MRKYNNKEYSELTYEQKAAIWQVEADKLGLGFCKDNYNKYDAELRAKAENKNNLK